MNSTDLTGRRFGMLQVLGKGKGKQYRTYYCYTWQLKCDCGNIIELPRSAFDRKGKVQKSCGCYKKAGFDNNRRPIDITGRRFGSLVAIALTGKKVHRKPTWLMKCDCGNTREISLTNIRTYLREGSELNCLSWSSHPNKYLRYPAAPSPYPTEAGRLVAKYLPLTEVYGQYLDAAIEDKKRDMLLRVAWIITYRRSQGERIDEQRERQTIKKTLRYASIKVFWERQVEKHGGFLYDVHGKKHIGSTMTNTTLDNYPVNQTQGKFPLSVLPVKRLRLRFKRC